MGGKTSTTTQQVQIPKEVMDRYNAVNAQAQQVASNPFQVYSTDPSKFVAQINQQQQAGINQINQASNSYQPFFQGAASAVTAGMGSADPRALNLNQFMNPYQQSVIDATMKQMGQANEQAQSGALGTAISSGAFGGDRAGVAAANLANQQNMAMGSTLAGLNAQNYNQALAAAQQQQGVYLGADQANLARLLQGGQTLAGLGSAYQQAGLQGAEAMLNAGTLQQQTEQAGLSALYNQFQQQQAYPFQVAQFLANIAMGTGALSGSTTTTTQPVPFFSDRRLKTDIKRIGTADNGLPVYTFKYKGDDTEQTHVGYMADEVEKVHPEAVGLHPSGYKVVDYDRASRAEGGGVAGPYGAMVGSQPGLGGYVPQAYLPVGELMVADPTLVDMSKQSLASQMEAASNFGDNLTDLYDKYGSVKRKLDDWAAARAAQNPFFGGGKAYGGGVSGAENPVKDRTYLSDTLDAQDKEDRSGLKPPGDVPQPRSILGDIVDAGKMVMAVAGMNHGGVAGRHGYATDGSVGPLSEEEMRRRLQAQTLGLKPADIPSATTLELRPQDIPAVRPAGLSTPELVQTATNAINSSAPQDAGLRPSATSPTMAPVQEVANLQMPGLAPPAAQSTADINPDDVFNTRILKQESGNKQFDPRTGQPLTSSAGAVGIAQVMPGTAPEAAKLAGLEWDEQRYRTDPDYNAALGRAYFRHQYNRFGSIDKAAAAYNAGPGALSSAIDRATALGGSYLDYLPEETQNYVRAVTGITGTGTGTRSAGLAGGQSYLSTSGEPATGVKPYADRTALGKFFHNADGTTNQDAILSILSGLGTMASSPSLYLGSAILQGIGGGANTYMARQEQQANIRNIDATALETTMRTAKDSIYPVDGVNMIMTKDGLMPFWDFMQSGRASTGQQMVDTMLRRMGQSAFANGMDPNSMDIGSTISVPNANGITGGQNATPEAAPPPGVLWSDASTGALAQDRALMRSQPGLWAQYVTQTAEMLPQITEGRANAMAGKPNINEMAYTVGSAINEGNMGSFGEWYANKFIKPLKTFLPQELTEDWSSPEAQSAILEKLKTLSATDMTPEQQRAASVFQQVSSIYPNLDMPPEAAAAITASVMLGNQSDIDRANYYNYYLQQQPTGRGALVNADAAFAREYAELQQREKANLTTLFDMADDPAKGAAVKRFLEDIHSGNLSQADAQKILTAILGPTASPVLARYFIKGM